MNRLLFAVFLMASQLVSFASNPSYENFLPTDFLTNGAPPWRIMVNLDNFQFTNNPRIRIINVSGVTGGTIWTNESSNYRPLELQSQLSATNIYSYQTLVAQGSFITPATLSTNLVPGTNELNTFNNGFVFVTGVGSNPADYNIQLKTGNGQGAHLWLENYSTNSAFTLFNHSLLADDPTSTVRLNGNWTPTEQGEAIYLIQDGRGWRELGRLPANGGFGLWTIGPNNELEPIDLVTWQPLLGNGLAVGTNTLAEWGNLGHFATLIQYQNVDAGDPAAWEIRLKAKSTSTGQEGIFDVYYDGVNSVLDLTQNGNRIRNGIGSTNDVGTYWDVNGIATSVAWIRPTAPDGTATARFDSSRTHTTGNLLEVANSSTNAFVVTPTSANVLHGGTNSIVLSGGQHGTITLHTPAGEPAALVSDDIFSFSTGNSGGGQWQLGTTEFDPTSDGVANIGNLGARLNSGFFGSIIWGATGATSVQLFDAAAAATPNGVVTADPGSVWRNTGGGAGTTLYVKESGTGNTGWTALGAGGGGTTGAVIASGAPSIGDFLEAIDTTGTNGVWRRTITNMIATTPTIITGVVITNSNVGTSPLIINDVLGGTGDRIQYTVGGSTKFKVTAAGATTMSGGATVTGTMQINSGNVLLSSDSQSYFAGAGNDTQWKRNAANELTFGAGGAAPSAFSVVGAIATGTDHAGGAYKVVGGDSTGTGAGGPVILQTDNSSTTGSSVNIRSERFHAPAKFVNLTESTDTKIFTVPVAAANYVGLTATITIFASDGTDHQSLTSVITVDGIAKTTTITPTISTSSNSPAASSGTLTVTFTAVDDGSNVMSVKANAVSSLTQTVLRAKVVITAINSNGTAAVTEQ